VAHADAGCEQQCVQEPTCVAHQYTGCEQQCVQEPTCIGYEQQCVPLTTARSDSCLRRPSPVLTEHALSPHPAAQQVLVRVPPAHFPQADQTAVARITSHAVMPGISLPPWMQSAPEFSGRGQSPSASPTKLPAALSRLQQPACGPTVAAEQVATTTRPRAGWPPVQAMQCLGGGPTLLTTAAKLPEQKTSHAKP